MYIPDSLKMTDTAQMHDFIDEFGFGVLVSPSLDATHLPLILKREEGKRGVLYGHFAKANPHWKSIDGQTLLVIFNGPHSYISPSWYSQSPAVPTWNYAAVHAYGTVSILPESRNAEVVEAAVAKYESPLLSERQVLTEQIQQRLLPAIVCFSITLTHLEGVEKLGQTRSSADQLGVYAALQQSDTPEDQALASYMRKHSKGIG